MSSVSMLRVNEREKAVDGVPVAAPVVVVVPTYNEASNIPELLRGLFSLGVPNLEILLVDDGSPDGTAELAEHLSPQYGGQVHVMRRREKQGLGTAYIAGFSWALEHGAGYVVEMDADLSHSPEYIVAFLARMEDHDVAVGSRWTAGGGTDPEWGFGRRLLSRGASLYCRLVLGLKVRDTTTGFKCFRRSALEKLVLGRIESQGFAFQVEVAYACQLAGCRVVEVPIRFRQRARGQSKMSSRIIVEAFWRVLAMRRRRRMAPAAVR